MIWAWVLLGLSWANWSHFEHNMQTDPWWSTAANLSMSAATGFGAIYFSYREGVQHERSRLRR